MVCVYEDAGWSDLSVLCDLRPVFDLRCGRYTLLEKLRRLYPREEFNLWVRDELAEVTAEAHPDCRVNRPLKKGRLFFSGRAILDKPVAPLGRESVLVAAGEVVGFRVCAECAVKMSSFAGLEAKLAVEEVKAQVVCWPWELVDCAGQELERELPKRGVVRGRLERGTVLAGPRVRLTVERGARVWPGAVISTENGPVLLDRGARVRPGSFVEGPCYVGPRTVIDGARVRPGCSFGTECRIGGEVEASVFQGYSNKRHDGYIGHSYVGEWVNLGALTTNSNLKNAYEPARVFVSGRQRDTGRLKVGCFIGDHVKTAIGSVLNTGAVMGTGANWFESGLSGRYVPRFSWGSRRRWRLGNLVRTARLTMARRGIEMSPAYERLLRRAFRRHAR